MMNLFECKVKHEKQLENGNRKVVTNGILVNAFTLTEAEARLVEYLNPIDGGEREIISAKKVNYTEYFKSEDIQNGYFYDCRVEFVSLDERTSAEKKVKNLILVKATDIDDAMQTLHKELKDTISDYEAISIKENDIIDIIGL